MIARKTKVKPDFRPTSASVFLVVILIGLTAFAFLGAFPTSAQSPGRAIAAAEGPKSPPADPVVAFARWKQEFAPKAIAAGLPAEFSGPLIAGLAPVPRALEQAQAASRFLPIWRRIEPLADPRRITAARTFLARHKSTLAAIEARYDVPAALLVALWGVETNFGQLRGSFDLLDVLATRAALDPEARWRSFGEENLLAALRMLRNPGADRSQLRASYAGATGQVQFIPTTFARFAVDFRGDGFADIWNDPADALASAANYLKQSGFRGTEPIAAEVRIPPDFDYLLAHDARRTIREWRALGIGRANGVPFSPAALDLPAELFVAAGRHGPAFLLFDNFEAIKVYNQADFYALALWRIAEELRGRAALRGSWPRHIPLISDAEALEMQNALSASGFPLVVDGRFGRETRRQLQLFQHSRGQIADGFPTRTVMEELRAALAQARAASVAGATAPRP